MKIHGKVLDLETKQFIPKVIWVDEEKGECEAYQVGTDGKILRTLMEDGTAGHKTVHLKGRFKFIPSQPKKDHTVRLGANYCARCKSPLTLMGNELCPRCQAKQKVGGKYKPKDSQDVKECHPFEFKKCCKCSRDATHSVADEVQVTPQLAESIVIVNGVKASQGKRLFDRGMTVGRRYFCAWCVQGPRIVDEHGEVIKTLSEEPANEELTRKSNK